MRQSPILSIPSGQDDCLRKFKALFNRTKDWGDIEEILEAQAGDIPQAIAWLKDLLGPEDPAVERLAGLAG
ncbi:MAG TPA: hypothetical protein VNU24_04465 [Solirubrobacteraceae bacterium]|nr:hypothetical protein [Solirubrobacteraceae bacterium]